MLCVGLGTLKCCWQIGTFGLVDSEFLFDIFSHVCQCEKPHRVGFPDISLEGVCVCLMTKVNG